MKIKDIVNRDIVNLTNCEHEPIHIPGSIQPHGFLIGVTSDSNIIDFCSGNCVDYTGITHQQFLGKSFESVFGKTVAGNLESYIENDSPLTSPLIITLKENHFFCSVHKSDNIYIIEAEPLIEDDKKLPNTYEQTRQFLSYIEQTKTLQQLCDLVAKGTREITGYDRVMIYRFDEQYNGEIFAESVREDLEPFLGLHYPHTDIPAQARELYMKNLLRLIADINYTPVPIYTIDNGNNKNLNLSHSILRSTSPIHVQYLQNMGVGATLTISLIHKNKLWGLIACHHYSQKDLSHSLRIAAQLQGHFLTSQIDVRQSNEEYNVARKSNEALEKFLSTSFHENKQSLAEIALNPQILEICNATGLCIYVNENIYKNGKTPPYDFIKRLITQLAGNKISGYNAVNISADFDEAKNYCDCAAGIIYHSLNVAGDDCIIWFRGETVTEVHWGGDPNKAIVKDENGLHPRNSFRLWKEIVKCRSKPWLNPELNAATNFSYTLQKHVNMLTLSEEEEKYRKLTEILKENNEELENINWISTHDLQEPLRKIQIMASRIISLEDQSVPKKMNDLVVRMNASAGRMQTLLKDILSYTKIKHTKELDEKVNLNELINEVLKNIEENIKEKKATLQIADLPVIDGIPFLLKQLFTNLITNALKFSDKERPQVITIGSADAEEHEINHKGNYFLITIADTGIGFDQNFAESIFNIFKRLHTQNEYEGSGVGLALCKKIMMAHNGFLTASGNTGKGAVFNLFFPVT